MQKMETVPCFRDSFVAATLPGRLPDKRLGTVNGCPWVPLVSARVPRASAGHVPILKGNELDAFSVETSGSSSLLGHVCLGETRPDAVYPP